jgi:hypothetical protein
MDTSILNSTKKILGISSDDESFDPDVITHINTAFSILNDLGVGPIGGYFIVDESDDWSDLGVTSVPMLSLIKTCVYLRVRLLFDPPASSWVLSAMTQQIQEHEWRLNEMRENVSWVDPNPPPPVEEVV